MFSISSSLIKSKHKQIVSHYLLCFFFSLSLLCSFIQKSANYSLIFFFIAVFNYIYFCNVVYCQDNNFFFKDLISRGTSIVIIVCSFSVAFLYSLIIRKYIVENAFQQEEQNKILFEQPSNVVPGIIEPATQNFSCDFFSFLYSNIYILDSFLYYLPVGVRTLFFLLFNFDFFPPGSPEKRGDSGGKRLPKTSIRSLDSIILNENLPLSKYTGLLHPRLLFNSFVGDVEEKYLLYTYRKLLRYQKLPQDLQYHYANALIRACSLDNRTFNLLQVQLGLSNREVLDILARNRGD